MLINGNNMRR